MQMHQCSSSTTEPPYALAPMLVDAWSMGVRSPTPPCTARESQEASGPDRFINRRAPRQPPLLTGSNRLFSLFDVGNDVGNGQRVVGLCSAPRWLASFALCRILQEMRKYGRKTMQSTQKKTLEKCQRKKTTSRVLSGYPSKPKSGCRFQMNQYTCWQREVDGCSRQTLELPLTLLIFMLTVAGAVGAS